MAHLKTRGRARLQERKGKSASNARKENPLATLTKNLHAIPDSTCHEIAVVCSNAESQKLRWTGRETGIYKIFIDFLSHISDPRHHESKLLSGESCFTYQIGL